MRSSISTAAAVAAVGLFAAAVSGCSSGSKSQDPGAGSSPSSSMTASSSPSATTALRTVMVKKTPLGKILVTGKGRTLYLFEADKTSKSTCMGACAKAWPPLLVTNTPTAESGVQSKLLSTSVRSGGAKQVTYKGHPLYTYLGDRNPGDLNGQGLTQFGAKWYVVGPDGKKITAAAPKSSSSPSSSSSASSSASTGSGY
ncbi:hypothetical protein OG372_07580 [Streptomyces sp. NBC_01020]|uniref:COG4315 family predicted lipoprotein n=1 Tax=unclassified Streptomyces TaxID=2593676 RepID=UPI002E1ED4D7|nr:hypothetical protein OG372_07580 [Streptomyces sp. NBC_01020]WSX70538.1 hypothetical protein OG221_30235 [Streptomyces sp. NBC_00932]